MPAAWEELQRSQQYIAERAKKFKAIYAELEPPGSNKTLSKEMKRDADVLQREITQELERTKHLRVTRENYRGWLIELNIRETQTRIRLVDPDGWMEGSCFIDGQSKGAALHNAMQLIDISGNSQCLFGTSFFSRFPSSVNSVSFNVKIRLLGSCR